MLWVCLNGVFGLGMFLDTEKAVKCNIIRNILLSDVKIGKDGRLQIIYP